MLPKASHARHCVAARSARPRTIVKFLADALHPGAAGLAVPVFVISVKCALCATPFPDRAPSRTSTRSARVETRVRRDHGGPIPASSLGVAPSTRTVTEPSASSERRSAAVVRRPGRLRRWSPRHAASRRAEAADRARMQRPRATKMSDQASKRASPTSDMPRQNRRNRVVGSRQLRRSPNRSHG